MFGLTFGPGATSLWVAAYSDDELRAYDVGAGGALTAASPRPAYGSRRVVTLTLPAGLRSIVVRFDGDRVPVRTRGARRQATIDLRGMARRRVVVRMTARRGGGRRWTQTRIFRTCRG
jgi:hypothetical protein